MSVSLFAQTNEEQQKAESLGLSDYQIIQLQEYAKQRGYADGQKAKPIGKDIESNFSSEVESSQTKDILDTVENVETEIQEKMIDTLVEKTKRLYGDAIFSKANFVKFNVENFRAGDNYVLGKGDQLNLFIWGASNFNNSYVIDETGAIFIERVGRVYLNGLSFFRAKKVLKSKLGTVFNLSKSDMEISLNYSRDIFVNIVGEVKNPGTYKIKGFHSVFNALFLANGVTKLGSLRKIQIKRDGKLYKTLDIYKYLQDPVYESKFDLQDNDFIYVPVNKKTVEINGEIKRPMKYQLADGEGMNQLLVLAGGVTSKGYPHNINVLRNTKDGPVIMDVNWENYLLEGKDFNLEDGDVVLIREISSEKNNFVIVKGAVNIPGEYEYTAGMRITDLIKQAEGVKFDAYLERFYLIRMNKDLTKTYKTFNLNKINEGDSTGNILLEPMDEITVFSKQDFVDKDSVTILGAVRKPGKYVYGEGINVKDLLYLSGGLKREAAISRIEISRIINYDKELQVYRPSRTIVKVINVDFNLGVSDRDAQFQLQPLDQIYIRTEPIYEEHQNVTLIGEVNYPGTYTLLTKEDRLLDVITRAGGLTNYAFNEGAKLYRSSNDQGYLFINLSNIKNHKEYNYILMAGDTLFVPKRNDLVSITGAIEYPNIDMIGQINAPYYKNKRARFYVKRFGVDFDKRRNALKRKTTVVLPNGIVTKTKNLGLFKIYPKVYKGCTVVVNVKTFKDKKDKVVREPIDYNKMFESFTVKVTGLLTLYFLVDRLTL